MVHGEITPREFRIPQGPRPSSTPPAENWVTNSLKILVAATEIPEFLKFGIVITLCLFL